VWGKERVQARIIREHTGGEKGRWKEERSTIGVRRGGKEEEER